MTRRAQTPELLRDVEHVAGLLVWPAEDEAAPRLHRAIRVDVGYDEPIEVFDLVGPYRKEELAAYDALQGIVPAKLGSHESGSVIRLARTSTRGARASELLAVEGGVDPVLALALGGFLVRTLFKYTGTRIENVAVTFEGDIVLAAVGRGDHPHVVEAFRRLMRMVPAVRQQLDDEDAGRAAVMNVEGLVSVGEEDMGAPDKAWIGEVVRRLFPERWSREEQWREEVALLDEETRLRLARSLR